MILLTNHNSSEVSNSQRSLFGLGIFCHGAGRDHLAATVLLDWYCKWIIKLNSPKNDIYIYISVFHSAPNWMFMTSNIVKLCPSKKHMVIFRYFQGSCFSSMCIGASCRQGAPRRSYRQPLCPFVVSGPGQADSANCWWLYRSWQVSGEL